MSFEDGYLVFVPMEREASCGAFAKKWTPVFKELGATQIYKCRGDDIPTDDMPFDGKRILFGGVRPLAVTE